MTNSTQQSRRWTFTIFTEDDPTNVHRLLKETLDDNRGIALQQEKCPTTGRTHIQGYAEFTKPKRFSTLQKQMPQGSHLEPARGNRQHNITYVSKDATRLSDPIIDPILLESTTQGRRSDLVDIGKQIADGDVDLLELADSRPDIILKYPRGLNALRDIALRKRQSTWRNVTTTVYYGSAGTGKTRKACDQPNTFILDVANNDNLWFDGYNGENVLVIDDFYGWIKHHTLLRILDGHPYRCPIKGAFVPACWTEVYITSNTHPRNWYKSISWEENKPLRRRLKHIYRVTYDDVLEVSYFQEEDTGEDKYWMTPEWTKIKQIRVQDFAILE